MIPLDYYASVVLNEKLKDHSESLYACERDAIYDYECVRHTNA